MDRKIVSALVLATFVGAAYAVDFPETEPNNTKATANLVTLNNGDSVRGSSQSASTTGTGALTADYFRIKTSAQPLGIYRHRLALTQTGTAGHVPTLRGLNQVANVVGTTDTQIQLGIVSTVPARAITWYGFGKQEEIYYRVAGATMTAGVYTSTLTDTTVAPVIAAGTLLDLGPVKFQTVNTLGTFNVDMWLYDSNFDAIVGAGSDNVRTGAAGTQGGFPVNSGFVQSGLAAGTYTMAIADFSAGNNLASPAGDGDSTSGNVMDFPNGYFSSVVNPPGAANVSLYISDNFGNVINAPVVFAANEFGQVAFVQFTISANTEPTAITATASAAPATVINDGTGTSLLRVTVNPGANPTTTPHTVVVTGAAIAGGSVVLLDNGAAPDAVSGDNIFTGAAPIASGTPVGPAILTYLVTTGADARTANGNITLTVREARGACCVGGVATIEDASACTTAGGTFLGDGSTVLLGGGRVFASSDTFPIAIPQFVTPTPGSASTSVTVSDPTTITSLAVRIGLTHTWVGDLIGTLSNGTTSVILFNRAGLTVALPAGSSNDIAGTYRIIAGAASEFGLGVVSPVPAGDYLVTGIGAGTLTSFNGSSIAGTWTLTITDNAAGDIGTITSFAIELNPTPCPAAPSCLADIVGAEGNPPGDGNVDGNDFQAFLNAFGAGDALADIVGGDGNPPGGDGADGNDFQAFLNAFGAGC